MEHQPKIIRFHTEQCRKHALYNTISEKFAQDKWPITFMCKHLKISRAAYYKWKHRKPTAKQREDEAIAEKIKEIAAGNNSLYGAMNMFYELRNEHNFTCGHNRVYRLMSINGIQSKFRRKTKYRYIKSTPQETAENILHRDFNAERPNQKWCTDVTEIRVPATGEKLFISPILDLYDRYPVSLEVSNRNDSELANRTFENAVKDNPWATPIFHSDRGFQYTTPAFRFKILQCGMTQSMSRVGHCIDNGPCEAFQGIFKDMLSVLYPNIRTKEEMLMAIWGTLEYYRKHYHQKRFGGKTCEQVRREALASENPIQYPIKQAARYARYWESIKKEKAGD